MQRQRQAGIEREKQSDRDIQRQTRQTDKQTSGTDRERETGRQTDRQTDSADRLIDIQTGRHTSTQRETEDRQTRQVHRQAAERYR